MQLGGVRPGLGLTVGLKGVEQSLWTLVPIRALARF